MPEGSRAVPDQALMGEESPRLCSPVFVSVHDQASGGPVPDSDCYRRLWAEPQEGDGGRPVSLVSTLSSGSSRDGHSLYGSSAALPSTSSASSTPPPPSEDDVDLELSPAPDSPGPGYPRGEWQDRGPIRRGGTSQSPPSPCATEAMAPSSKLTYVDRVVMEIIETERMYVRDLRSIVEDYLAHIIDVGNLPIRPEQVCALFGNIEDIYEFNSELLQSLDLCESDPVAVARCFVDKSDNFEIYTQYCTNYPNSVAALTECMRSKALAKFFRDRQASLKRSLPLGSYLLKPVQRILKYHLLLQEIVRHYDPEEEGYEVVREAIDTMTGVAWYINDMKRKHEHAVRLQEIQSLLINWKGPDLTTYGELVLEGTFHVHRAKNTRTLFLFDRILLITKKRGEHYVYKTHISCSTLMLLESAKDPLHFSVIHFKHPKQPHTVQAKTVEEKRLWAHHIKRLILENHHTILPQKAREAILEMDSIYPGKYRYSPERLKKDVSCQTEDGPGAGRHGRRRSEPSKRLIRTTKAILKHADSEGALLGGDRRSSLQPSASVNTLDSGLGEPEAERPGGGKEDAEEEMGSLERDSLERLMGPGGGDPRVGFSPGKDGLEQQEEEKQEEVEEERESYKEDVLLEDDQVADFASSMLAAISCWHYRARALLSAQFSTEEEERDVADQETPERQEEKTTSQEERTDVSRMEVVNDQVCLKDTPPQISAPQTRVEEEEEEEEEDASGHSPPADCPPLPPRGAVAETPEPEETPSQEEETPSQEEESDSSALQVDTSNSSFVTNEEFSEEEEEEGEESGGIPPPSVLDQAGAIAERLADGHSRRGSLVSEELRPPPPQPGGDGCNDDAPSLGADLPEKTPTQPTSDPPTETPSPPEAVPSTPAPDPGPADPPVPLEEAVERRSTLSKRDRLLIHKIRRYYEHAEHQDAAFSIKRRESLSYIPAGLVRHLSRQLDGADPRDQATPLLHRKASAHVRPTSWSVFNLPGLERGEQGSDVAGPDPQRRAEDADTPGSRIDDGVEVADAPAGAEEFRPSSEMVAVWRDMETEASGSSEEPRADGRDKEGEEEGEEGGGADRGPPGRADSPEERVEPLRILEELDAGSVSEESFALSPLPAREEGVTGLDLCPSKPPMPAGRRRRRPARAPLPRIISLRSGVADELILQDMERVKSKVFQLARQYSQRIKNNRPLVRQRNREGENLLGLKNLPAVHEENPQSTGKPSLTLPLSAYDQVIVQETRPLSPSLETLSSGASSRVTSPCPPLTSGPSSPVQTESFHWPDVRELRSKYTPGPRGTDPRDSRPSVLGRSSSVPEGVLESSAEGFGGGPWSSTDGSFGCNGSVDPRGAPAGCRGGERGEGPAGETHPRPPLCRWSSLDHMLPLHELQNLPATGRNCCFVVGGHASAPPDERRVIVVERVGAGGGPGDGGGQREEDGGGRRGQGGTLQDLDSLRRGGLDCSRMSVWKKTERSLVKNLRERFQHLSS